MARSPEVGPPEPDRISPSFGIEVAFNRVGRALNSAVTWGGGRQQVEPIVVRRDQGDRIVRASGDSLVPPGSLPPTDTAAIPEGRKPEILKLRLHASYLVPILVWAYGNKDWHDAGNDAYWDQEKGNWQYQSPAQESKALWPEETTQMYDYLKTVVRWGSNPSTWGHLFPPPGVPEPVLGKPGKVKHRKPNFDDPADVDHAVADLARRLYNFGQPQKLITKFALTSEKRFVGIVVNRLKGDPNLPKGKIGLMELLITDPDFRRQGVALSLAEDSLDMFFEELNYNEVRLWMMSDPLAGEIGPNLHLFANKLGMKQVQGPWGDWQEYVQKRDIEDETEGRSAMGFGITKERWKTKKGNTEQLKTLPRRES